MLGFFDVNGAAREASPVLTYNAQNKLGHKGDTRVSHHVAAVPER